MEARLCFVRRFNLKIETLESIEGFLAKLHKLIYIFEGKLLGRINLGTMMSTKRSVTRLLKYSPNKMAVDRG